MENTFISILSTILVLPVSAGFLLILLFLGVSLMLGLTTPFWMSIWHDRNNYSTNKKIYFSKLKQEDDHKAA